MKPKSQIESRLHAVRTRIRRVQGMRAAMVMATVALGGLIAVMAVDYLLAPLPTAARWGLTGAWVCLVAAAVRFGLAPLAKPIDLIRVARWLESRHPEMEERLSTALELESTGGGVSADLIHALAQAAEADAGTVDADAEIKAARTSLRWGRPALGLAAALALSLAVWPSATARLLARAVMPFSKIGNAEAGRFIVKSGNLEVLEGDPVEIQIDYSGPSQTVDLAMELEDGSQISQPMTRSGSHFHYRLDPAKTGFTYQARAGRAQSDGYTVKVWPLPRTVDPRVTLDFPEYTGAPPRETTPEGGISAVIGTRVTLVAQTNTAISSASLRLGEAELAAGTVENSASLGQVTFAWTLAAQQSGEAVVTLSHRLGREIEALRFRVEALADQVPEVILLSPVQRDLKIRPDDILPLVYQVTEDFALAKVELAAEVSGKEPVLLPLPEPERAGLAGLPMFRGRAQASVGELRSHFPGAQEIRVRIRAEDKRPQDLGGPGVGFSEWVTLRIDDGAESLARQELREQHDGAKETIERAIQSVREARERMDWHRQEVKKDTLSENGVKNLKEAGEKLAAAEQNLDALAAQMKEGIHAAKADAITQAADTVAKARDDLEAAPLQDEEMLRDEKLQAARDESESAVKQLENVRNAMDRDRERINDLARVQDLASQQSEQARQAAADLATAAPLPDDWRARQREIAEALAQQLRERPQSKAEALKTQAAQATQLAEQAREMAGAQKDLGRQAEQPTAEALAQALAAEQAKLTAEANAQLADAREARSDLADTLPAATSAAETARDEIQKGNAQAAAEAGKVAAEAMKASASASPAPETAATPERAHQAADVAALGEQQAQLAQAMDALAKGDTAAALQGLQAARAENAEELAKAVAAMPQVEGNGHMNEAKGAGKQGAEQATAAAAQGQSGQQQAAAPQHEQSAANFGKAAEALTRAAGEFARQSAEAAARSENPNRANVSPAAMAEAFQQAAMAAASPDAASAAESAAAAAQALAQAAQAGRQQMQGRQPGTPGMPNGMAGEHPEEGPRSQQADPGVPPELAKLGISAGDWAKIQSSLKSDVGAGEAAGVPAEYRDLVRSYFESISKKSTNP